MHNFIFRVLAALGRQGRDGWREIATKMRRIASSCSWCRILANLGATLKVRLGLGVVLTANQKFKFRTQTSSEKYR